MAHEYFSFLVNIVTPALKTSVAVENSRSFRVLPPLRI